MNVKIDPQNGEFTVGEQHFSGRLEESEFLSSQIGKSAKKIRISESRNYYETWQNVSSEFEVGLTLGFSNNGLLQRISAQFVRIGLRGSQWSKASEDQIKRFHDAWLKKQLGNPPYQFAWGRVKSIVEPHWYSANIIFSYTRTKNRPVRVLHKLFKISQARKK